MAHDKPRHPDRQPRHAEDVDERIEKESAVTPRHDEIFDDRPGQDEFHQRGDAERKSPPIALGRVGDDEVVPAELVKVRDDAPVRSPGLDRPACHRAVVGQPRRRDLALHVPGFLEPRHFADEAAMLVFRSDRLVACHLHETTLAHERLRHFVGNMADPSAGSLGNMAWPIKRGGHLRLTAAQHSR